MVAWVALVKCLVDHGNDLPFRKHLQRLASVDFVSKDHPGSHEASTSFLAQTFKKQKT